MKKRFFYVASVDSDNAHAISLSGLFDTSESIDTLKIVSLIEETLEKKGVEGISVHISQLNFLMDVPDD